MFPIIFQDLLLHELATPDRSFYYRLFFSNFQSDQVFVKEINTIVAKIE